MSDYLPKQGDIIRLNFDLQVGHEQKGRRPAVVVSNDTANRFLNTRAIVCPVTHTNKGIPIQPVLDERTDTQGVVLCDQVKTIDYVARRVEYIERLPEDILDEVIDIVYGMIERLPIENIGK
jgi:mRNA interferase MazF